MSDHTDLNILGVFSLLSILAVGGGTAVLPEMKALTVDVHHWLSDDQFRNIYGLGQLAPGPNMLMVIVIGYHVAGFVGAALAFVGFFAPASIIAWGTSRIWNHFEGSPWRLSVQRGFAPLVIGLMTAGTISIARTAITGWIPVVFAVVVFCVLYFRHRVNPALMILAAAIAGVFLLR
ncbi:chromate transporter [Segnochrobactrum spirostomi]|uniref:Chromate transporter n=1 Tax=Segnochrobactrum spirostomi TaxID=2608987 RepID=A0A6A7Y6X0_9HYPH|nr:chromate transporter [Segnochrobactrum spirostomi]MQT13831.1 chromate transporter [Segnochrobactrum spirostomi]